MVLHLVQHTSEDSARCERRSSRRFLVTLLKPRGSNINEQRGVIALNRQGTQQKRPESPSVTPPGMGANTGHVNSTKGTSSGTPPPPHQHHHHLSLNREVVGGSQMISQPVSSSFPNSPLPSGTWRIPGLSIS